MMKLWRADASEPLRSLAFNIQRSDELLPLRMNLVDAFPCLLVVTCGPGECPGGLSCGTYLHVTDEIQPAARRTDEASLRAGCFRSFDLQPPGSLSIITRYTQIPAAV